MRTTILAFLATFALGACSEAEPPKPAAPPPVKPLAQPAQTAAAAPAPAPAAPSADELLLAQVTRALKSDGLETVPATDGQDAWDQLRGGAAPNLIVCDVNMPKMNGLELLERLQEDAAYAELPVLMLTTEGEPDLIRRARQMGAKGWLVKPFQPELLLAAVTKLVSRAA